MESVHWASLSAVRMPDVLTLIIATSVCVQMTMKEMVSIARVCPCFLYYVTPCVYILHTSTISGTGQSVLERSNYTYSVSLI